jgi:hypothetical protein
MTHARGQINLWLECDYRSFEAFTNIHLAPFESSNQKEKSLKYFIQNFQVSVSCIY